MITEIQTFVVIFNAKKGKEQDLKKLLLELAGESSKEWGCLNFDLHESLITFGQFMIYENWENKAAHESHDKSVHVLKWRENKHEVLEGVTEVSKWKHIS